MTKAMSRARIIRGKVMDARAPTKEVTERPVRIEVPKSPRASALIQSKYCAINGRFRPSCSRSWVTRSGGELTPAITEATSPGRMRNAAKTTTDRPNNATTNNASRFNTNRIMPTLLGLTMSPLTEGAHCCNELLRVGHVVEGRTVWLRSKGILQRPWPWRW